MSDYDIDFVGHLCYDEVIHADGHRTTSFGGAAVYGAIAAASLGKKVATELKLSAEDMGRVQILKDRSVDVYPIEAPETTHVEVFHNEANVDERRIITRGFAGEFCADGVLVRCGDVTSFERFTNRSSEGRTGRGDTTFGSYLASRIDHEPAEALKYAAALVSLKMEKPGPFDGTLDDVWACMRESE
jgi:sugar/nucleoside kinase (ribokinase family)